MTAQVASFGGLAELKKIGHITPSSNTALEPLTAMMNTSLAHRVSHHFTRIRVRQMTLDENTSAQFDFDTMVTAASLLADSPVDAIVWNGTSASWLGLERDVELSRRIRDATGRPASTSTLAFFDVFRRLGFRRIGLAVPYTSDLTAQIGKVYGDNGVSVVGSACLEQSVNIDVGNNPFDTIRDVLRRADSPEAECIAVVCTNFAATPLVDEMEKELGKPIIDSIAVTFLEGCRLAGVDCRMEGWGALMAGRL